MQNILQLQKRLYRLTLKPQLGEVANKHGTMRNPKRKIERATTQKGAKPFGKKFIDYSQFRGLRWTAVYLHVQYTTCELLFGFISFNICSKPL